MSDQGEIPDGRVSDFGLIETLAWSSDGGFFLCEEHLARLSRSAAELGFACDCGAVARALEQTVKDGAADRLRVRLVLRQNGAIEVGATRLDLEPAEKIWRVARAQSRFNSRDPLLRHKTTRREIYESELAASGADEVLFQNERDEICEGARMNVFLPQGDVLLTPPLACGLLPGTLRANLLAKGAAAEQALQPDDFKGREFYMGNSVRGLVRARLWP